jgi:hypothetical protein
MRVPQKRVLKGSQKWLQLVVNQAPHLLDRAIAARLNFSSSDRSSGCPHSKMMATPSTETAPFSLGSMLERCAQRCRSSGRPEGSAQRRLWRETGGAILPENSGDL